MKEGTAPGPDGYTMEFLKKSWETIKPELTSAIKYCFYSEKFPASFNSTIITLVPKISDPVAMKESHL